MGNNRDLVRIILSNPRNTELTESVFIDRAIAKRQQGPGSYDLEAGTDIIKKRYASVTDWSRSTGKRFARQKNKTPGPGAYQVDKNHKLGNSLSASFAYQGLRSCMDELVYKTKMPFKVRVIEEKGLKDRFPGPGSYNPRPSGKKSFHYGEGGFGSTSYPHKE